MFLGLPSDVCLHVLSYLSVADLLQLRLVSREVNSYFAANEESIFHQAAIYHNLVRSQTSLQEVVRNTEDSWLDGVSDWKEFCRRQYALERNWDGDGFVHGGGYPPGGHDTLISFYVDETQDTYIALSGEGGLTVHALEDNRLLWALGKDYILQERIECSSGFLVFPTKDSGLEIWRRAADILPGAPTIYARGRPVSTPVAFPAPAAARDFQLQASAVAPVDRSSPRGHFVPHAFISTGGSELLFRLCFPLLAYMAFPVLRTVILVDVPTGETAWRVAVFPEEGPSKGLGMPASYAAPPTLVMDLDLSRTHVCVCMSASVHLLRLPRHCTEDIELPRVEGGEEGSLEVPLDMLVFGVTDHPAVRQARAQDRPIIVTGRGQTALDLFEVGTSKFTLADFLRSPDTSNARPCFVCVRLSPDGRHIAAGAASGLLYFAGDFERARDGMLFADLIECLSINGFVRDLCWDPDSRRLAVRTVSESVVLITPGGARRFLRGAAADGGQPLSIAHGASAARLYWFSDQQRNTRLHAHEPPFVGMQMTQTALWFVGGVEFLRNTLGKGEEGEVGNEDVDGNGNEGGDTMIRVDVGTGSLCFLDFTAGI